MAGPPLSKTPLPDSALQALHRQIQDLEDRALAYETDTDVLDDELRELFHAEIQRVLSELHSAVPQQDESAIRDCAHTLLGTGGVAGAPEISVLGEELSQAAKDRNWPRCNELSQAFSEWASRWNPVPSAGESERSGTAEESIVRPQLEGRILVVDDERANRSYLKKFLTECGAEVLIAENGEQALEMMSETRPDLALVDVVMPGIQGYEVCEQITRNPETRHTPVIMVTAKSTPGDVETAFQKGAFDYIRKPFNSRELLARVRNALTLKRQTDALVLWKSRVSRELETAGKVQSRLFDPTPEFDALYDFEICYRPSQHIGGDMFDLLHLSNGCRLAYLADVAGHGVGSALISTLIKGIAQEILSGDEVPALHEIGNEIHARFRKCVDDPELYATMLIVLWRPGRQEIACLSCGHPPPLVFDEDNARFLEKIPATGGMPIGLMPPELGKPYREEDVIRFRPPSPGKLYLYTDGISESRNAQGMECGEEGLLRAIADCPGCPPDAVLAHLKNLGFQLEMDDCTLMSLRLFSESGLLMQGTSPAELEALQKVTVQLASALREQGWHDEDAGMAQLLMLEHGVNVITHGEPGPDSGIFYRVHLEGNQCCLVMKDRGIAWDPSHWSPEPPKAADPFSEHGRGLELISRISSSKQYFRRNHQNCFVYRIDKNLRKRLNA